MLPLTEELQAKKLREKCERVIYGHVSTVFRDGKRSGGVTDLFYFLHLSERHSMTTVLDFCIPVASEYTARERQKAMTTYHISNELKFKIGILAEERHEVCADDDKMLFQLFKNGGYKHEFDYTCNQRRRVPYPLPEFIYQKMVKQDCTRNICDHLRGLRLICRHCPDNKDLISKAVDVIKEDMATPIWSNEFQYQYDLLPQKIKNVPESPHIS